MQNKDPTNYSFIGMSGRAKKKNSNSVFSPTKTKKTLIEKNDAQRKSENARNSIQVWGASQVKNYLVPGVVYCSEELACLSLSHCASFPFRKMQHFWHTYPSPPQVENNEQGTAFVSVHGFGAHAALRLHFLLLLGSWWTTPLLIIRFILFGIRHLLDRRRWFCVVRWRLMAFTCWQRCVRFFARMYICWVTKRCLRKRKTIFWQ